MAVIKGIEVTIQVNGQALPEYDDFNDDDPHDTADVLPHSVSKYVEATSGARFAIDYAVPKSAKKISEGLHFKIYLDGAFVLDACLIMKSSMPKGGAWRSHSDGSIKWTKTELIKRPFIFSDIKCSDDASSTCRQERIAVESLGAITIKVWRTMNYRRKQRPKRATGFIGHLNNVEELPEKMLKGKSLTHAISLGEEERSGSLPGVWMFDYRDGENSPFAIFTFKYCSKKALQSLLLIPRTPSPERTPPPVPLEERPEDELTNEELRELARRQRARFQAEREANIKAESGIKSERDTKAERGIKRLRDIEVDELMASASAKKVKGPIASGEIVDLSD